MYIYRQSDEDVLRLDVAVYHRVRTNLPIYQSIKIKCMYIYIYINLIRMFSGLMSQCITECEWMCASPRAMCRMISQWRGSASAQERAAPYKIQEGGG